jgi:hypothetical protein
LNDFVSGFCGEHLPSPANSCHAIV